MTEEKPRPVRRVVEAISRALDELQRLLMAAVVLILTASALLLFWQVVDRTVFQGGQNWIEEYARLSLIWLTFLGAAALMREGRHLAVDYFVDKFPERVRGAFALGTNILIIALLGVLLGHVGIVWASSSVLLSPSLGIPRSILALAAIISYTITVVYCLESIARQLLRMDVVRQFVPGEDEVTGTEFQTSTALATRETGS